MSCPFNGHFKVPVFEPRNMLICNDDSSPRRVEMQRGRERPMNVVRGFLSRFPALSIPLFLRLPLVAAALVLAGFDRGNANFPSWRSGRSRSACLRYGKAVRLAFCARARTPVKAHDIDGIRKAFHAVLTGGEFDQVARIYLLSRQRRWWSLRLAQAKI